MSEAFIVRRGGGVGKMFAAIGVTYPAGSSCTCTKGSKTLRAGDTTDKWVFPVPEAGTWTVTATDGADTATKTVSITAQGQCTTVTLAYWDGGLYDHGNEYTSITGGWTGYTTKGEDYLELTHSLESFRYMQCTNNIDVTNFTKATLTVKNNARWAMIRLNVGAAIKEVQLEESSPNDMTIQLDISGVSGAVTVQVGSKRVYDSAKFQMVSLKLS